ncbi:hypothetical protein OSTOST_12213, partial [Ostertagia ostertagi]
VSFCFASDDISEVRQAMAKHFNYNVTSQCVTGHVSIFKWSVMYSNLHMTLPVIPVYIAVLVLRRLTIVKLHSDTALSEKTKHLHKQLLTILAEEIHLKNRQYTLGQNTQKSLQVFATWVTFDAAVT